MSEIIFNETSQILEPNAYGYLEWQKKTKQTRFDTSETALILCDVWDKHWARAFTERVERRTPYMNLVVEYARKRGVTIIHAPSGVAANYDEHPARKRVLDLKKVEPFPLKSIELPQYPLVSEPYSMDTGEPNSQMKNVWTSIHKRITIDESRDLILESDYQEFCNIVAAYGFKKYIIMGGATNMCMLHRNFALIIQKKMGLDSLFVRDCSIVAYSPQCSPYVPFEEAQDISMDYIEKFICPSIMSEDFLSGI